MNWHLWLLGLCLLAVSCTRPELDGEARTLEVYVAEEGAPGVELPDLLPIRHPLLLRQTLAGADSFRQEVGAWLRHPRLLLVESRRLDLPGAGEHLRVSGQTGDAGWTLESRDQDGQRQVRLTVREEGRKDLSSGWTDLGGHEDLVLGMPLASGAGLLLRLPPVDAASPLREAVPESLRGESVFRELEHPPSLRDSGTDLARIFAYPPQARRDGVQGTVRLLIQVDKAGRVQDVELQSGVRADLDSAAMAGARTLRFTAGRDGQGPVSTWVTLPVRYQLEAGATKP